MVNCECTLQKTRDLNWLNFEVERNKGKNETLERVIRWPEKSCVYAYLQILDEVVEYTKPFGVLTVLDINQGPNFCGLTHREYRSLSSGNARTSKAMWSFPTRISSSCFPTIFFFGQLVSSSLE